MKVDLVINIKVMQYQLAFTHFVEYAQLLSPINFASHANKTVILNFKGNYSGSVCDDIVHVSPV